MGRFVRIGEASQILGVSTKTLRRGKATGRFVPEYTTGGHRRYNLAKLKRGTNRSEGTVTRRTVAYACVSSHDQKADLERRRQVLELYCARHGWIFEVVADLGSGLN